MRKRAVVLMVVCIGIAATLFFIFSLRMVAPDKIRGVETFGPIRIGEKTPHGGPGDWTFAPLNKIPLSRFYVAIAHTGDEWCDNEDCSLDGALIQTMGGWLQVATTRNFPDLPSIVGFDMKENKRVQSLVLVAQEDGTLVGIYPNRGLKDVLPILRLHPNLADFSLLKDL